MRVAIQGTRGSFSEAAARQHWPEVQIVACREAPDVVAAVRQRDADAGCLPIENSLVGSVTTTYDLMEEAFGDGSLQLIREIVCPIHHTLMGIPGTTLANIRRVLSHPVALGQCRHWLGEHLPAAELVSAWDTAGSAEIVATQKDASSAAIAARHAADAYGLEPIAECIEDDPTNQTRFLLFTRARAGTSTGPLTHHKTSLIVLLEHRPGMLAQTLQAFATRNINLLALQSRPEPSIPWTYRFYMDIDGATSDAAVTDAIREITSIAAKVVILGSYES